MMQNLMYCKNLFKMGTCRNAFFEHLKVNFSATYLRARRTNEFQSIKLVMGMWAKSLRYCNARPTLDGAGASSYSPSPFKNKFNIEEGT